MHTLVGMDTTGPNGSLVANNNRICDVWITFHRHPQAPARFHSATLGVVKLSEAVAAAINEAESDGTLELIATAAEGERVTLVAGEIELIKPAKKGQDRVLIKALDDGAWRQFAWDSLDDRLGPAPESSE